MFQSTKSKITVVICILIIIVSIILNIVLLSTKVFKGSYTAHDKNGNTITIIFYDNTYTLDRGSRYDKETGFYHYQALSDYNQSPTSKNLEKDCILLLSSTSFESDTYYLYKDSVFHLSYAGWGNSSIEDMEFYCGQAIFLQVLFPTLIVASIGIIVLIYKKKIFKE